MLEARVIANLRDRLAVQVSASDPIEKAFVLNQVPMLVAGDRVYCTRDKRGTLRINALIPRHSVLERADRYRLKPLAANLTHLGIVSAVPPGLDTLLIDQFCVAAERAGFAAMIIFNKMDRLSNTERADVEQLTCYYNGLGYVVAQISTKLDCGLAALEKELPNRSLTLVGASGVGKSSIIKKLLPNRELRIGEISQATGLGAHTTSVTHWYALPSQGAIIDSPGVRQYSLSHLSVEDVKRGFREISQAAMNCRFGNCSHTVEPGCAVLEELKRGKIAQWRYRNFLKLIGE